MTDTQRTVTIYDLKDQCGRCAEVVREHRMASCPYNQHSFPAAHNCPRFRYDWEDSNG
jgi:hypothetical protein